MEGTSRSARHWEVEFRVSTIRGCPVDGHNSDEVITAVVSAAVVVCLAATAGTAAFVSRGVGAGPLSGNEAPDGEVRGACSCPWLLTLTRRVREYA